MEKHQGCGTNMNLTFKCLPLQSKTLPLAQPFKNYINYITARSARLRQAGEGSALAGAEWKIHKAQKSTSEIQSWAGAGRGVKPEQRLWHQRSLGPLVKGLVWTCPSSDPFSVVPSPGPSCTGETWGGGESRASLEETLCIRVHTEFNAVHFLGTKCGFPRVTKPKFFQPVCIPTPPLCPRLPSVHPASPSDALSAQNSIWHLPRQVFPVPISDLPSVICHQKHRLGDGLAGNSGCVGWVCLATALTCS